MRKWIAILALVVLASCGKDPAPSAKPSGGNAPGGEKVLVYARGGDSERLDPQNTTSGESVKVTTQIFDTLVDFADDSSKVVPSLATKWTVSEDGKTWTFELREGVTFHDGTPFDSEAVVFSLNRLRNPNDPNRHGAKSEYESCYEVIEDVKSDGPHRVVIRLKTPFAPFLANLAMFPAAMISPAAVIKHKTDFGRNPVGTGPFRFEKWVPNAKIVLSGNKEYWGGRPKVDKLIFKVVPDNSNRLLDLRNGEAHIMDGLNCADIGEINRDPSITAIEAPGMNFGYLAMNTEKPPLDNKKVRQAVAHAIDKKRLVQLVTFGHGQVAVNPIPPTVWGYNDSIEDWPHDVEKAKSLLAEAGFPDGVDVELWAMTNPRPYMPEPKRVVAVLMEDLARAGIRVKAVENEFNAHLPATKNGQHEMCILGWITDNGDPDNFLNELLSSKKAVHGTAANVSFFRNARYDELVERAQIVTDEGERARLYREAQVVIHEECPMVPLLYMPEACALRKAVKGYKLHPMGLIRLRNVDLE
ncbi:MAG: ABC transporter substrate-binding protein [Planctomycetota bacterium]